MPRSSRAIPQISSCGWFEAVVRARRKLSNRNLHGFVAAWSSRSGEERAQRFGLPMSPAILSFTSHALLDRLTHLALP